MPTDAKPTEAKPEGPANAVVAQVLAQQQRRIAFAPMNPPPTLQVLRRLRAVVVPLAAACLAACDGGVNHVPAAAVAPASAPALGASRPAGLVLPLAVNAQLAETFVRIGFGQEQGFQSTEFLTPRLRTAQAAPLIRLVRQYNDFEGERVAAAVEKLRGRVSGVEFGRDGSPVLYIELPYWTHQREEVTTEGMGVRIPDADNDALVQELRLIFVGELRASQFSVNRRRVRIWWR